MTFRENDLFFHPAIGDDEPFDFPVKIAGIGSVKVTDDFLIFQKKANAVDMDGTGTGILFQQKYYDATTPAFFDLARLSAVTEMDATSTASTQDGYLSFQTAQNGTVSEKMKLDSDGILTLSAGVNANTLTMTTAFDNTGFNFINTATGGRQFRMMSTGGTSGYGQGAFVIEDTTGGTARLVINAAGNIGVGAGNFSPSSLLDLQKAGTVTTTVDFLEITNTAQAASMGGTGTGILWNQFATDSNPYPLINITGEAQGNWTSTASTRDGIMRLSLVEAGVLTQKMVISKIGVVIGSPASESSRAQKGMTIANSIATTFLANTDMGDGARTFTIYNSNVNSNTMSAITLRTQPAGANNILDMKLLGDNTAAGNRLIYTWNGASVSDVYCLTSQGFQGLGTITPKCTSSVNGSQSVKRTATGAADYNPSIATTDYIIAVDNTAAARAVIISTEDVASGSTDNPRVFIINDESMAAGTNNITVSLESGNIDNAATAVINANGDSISIYLDGTNGWIF